ncbi:MAG: GGDEF domain-containing protein [Pseudomonadota bacterium]
MARDQFGDVGLVEQISSKAMAHAQEHSTPLTPMVYELWYNYVAGGTPPLNEKINTTLDEGAPITQETVLRLHSEFFSDVELKRGLTTFGAEIADRIASIGGTLETNGEEVANYAKSISALSGKLSRQSAAEQVIHSAGKLSAMAEKQAEATMALSKDLASARLEILEFREEIERLQQLCDTDHLTKVNNRRRFDERLADALTRVRAGDNRVCLVLADIDLFKVVNDKYGHAAGDKVLVKFAEIMRKAAKGSDTVARLGGEEFAILMDNTSLKNANDMAERLREFLMKTPFADPASGQKFRVTSSFGVTAIRENDDAASALSRADELLYDAKSLGRNMVVSGV